MADDEDNVDPQDDDVEQFPDDAAEDAGGDGDGDTNADEQAQEGEGEDVDANVDADTETVVVKPPPPPVDVPLTAADLHAGFGGLARVGDGLDYAYTVLNVANK